MIISFKKHLHTTFMHKCVFCLILIIFKYPYEVKCAVSDTKGIKQTQKTDFLFTSRLQLIYTELCKLKVKSAKQALSQENNENGIKILLDDYYDMILLLNNGTYSDYSRLSRNENIRLKAIKELDEESPFYLFVQAEIKLHWVAVKFRYGEDIKAAYGFIQAYKLLEQNRKMYPAFIPQLKSLGIMHIILGSMPDKYLWMLKLAGLKGDILQGQKELNLAITDPIFGVESQFDLFFIQAYLLEFDKKNIRSLQNYVYRNSEYLSIYFLASAISLRTNQCLLAEDFIINRPVESDYLSMPIFHFYMAETFLQQGKYDEAISCYSFFLGNYKGMLLVKDALAKIFFSYWIQNENVKAMIYLNKISSAGSSLTDADRFAQKIYDTYNSGGQLPNKELLKARFAYEGGFNEKAEQYINSINQKTIVIPKQRIEFNYRKALISYKLNKLDDAIRFFNVTILLSQGKEWGFGAISCLQLGYIYNARGDKSRALKYFNDALKYKTHESKNYVDIKARTAINVLHGKI